ncbi:bifunctional ornithine acetyltransferase/N-acetylglutamate synthase, partial [Staphylococcus aureus]
NFVCTFFADATARDGEAATKLISVNLSGANSISDARELGKTIVSANLVEPDIFGEDANFGLIITAIGYSGCAIDPNCTDVQ